MAYVRPYVKLTLSGETCDGNEIFNTGLHLSSLDTTTDPYGVFQRVVGQLSNMVPVFTAFWGNTDVNVPTTSAITTIKVALVGTDGKYMEQVPVEEEVLIIGSSNAPYSPQDATVITLDSGKRKDPGKYNRMYIPTAGNVGANAWRRTTTAQLNIATAAATMFHDLEELFGSGEGAAPIYVAVLSSNGSGHDYSVEQVRVGAIVDTQRRRRNKLTEDYVTVPVPAV